MPVVHFASREGVVWRTVCGVPWFEVTVEEVTFDMTECTCTKCRDASVEEEWEV